MLILKFLQTLIKALNSDGTPGQVGAGMALGIAFGLTPIASLHNLAILAIAMLTTVSFPGVMLGWAVAIPVGFLLDPVFDRIGMALLTNDALTPLFTWIVNTPIVSFSRLNNTIVLGSLVAWMVVFLPAFFLFRFLVARYRVHVFEKLAQWKVFKALKASKLYGVYEMFPPVSWIRWKALLPLAVVLALLLLGGLLFLDPATRRGVEAAGTAAVGAKVDLAKAHVGILEGHVTLTGLAVTDPSKPMTNLFEAEQLVFDVGLLPALEKKIVIDTMAVRGLRFGTPRKVSGALPRSGEPEPDEPGAVQQAVDAWMAQVKVPPLSLSTLTQSVNVDAISAESLATLRAARTAVAFADTARTQLLADLQALDPRPTIDSAEALATRLRAASLRSLGIGGVRTAVADVRRTLKDLDALDNRLERFQVETRTNAKGLGTRLEAIPAARQADYAYAKSLLRLPTFEIPAIGPQLFSGLVSDKVGQVMYWVTMAEKYVPPGLERQMKAGPKRARASGTDVLFPKERNYPSFLTRLAELSLAIGGDGAAAGDYSARVIGATTQPAVYGAPTRFQVTRTEGRVGPRDARVYGALDHRGAPVRDSLSARFAGIPLPTLPLGGLGATVALGDGISELQLTRTGDQLAGHWTWRSAHVQWTRDTLSQPRATSATMRLVEDALWRALARIDSVEIEARFSGSLKHPELGIRTNLANAVASALQEQLGAEVRRAEQQVRARVDALVDAKVAEARAKGDQVKADVDARIAAERAKLEAQRVALEAKLKDLVRIPGIG